MKISILMFLMIIKEKRMGDFLDMLDEQSKNKMKSYTTLDRTTALELEVKELKKELKQLKDNLYEVIFNDKEFANDK